MNRTHVFPVTYFNSQMNLENGIMVYPPLGYTFKRSVDAPCIGKEVYRVVRINNDETVECDLISFTCRHMTEADAI